MLHVEEPLFSIADIKLYLSTLRSQARHVVILWGVRGDVAQRRFFFFFFFSSFSRNETKVNISNSPLPSPQKKRKEKKLASNALTYSLF